MSFRLCKIAMGVVVSMVSVTGTELTPGVTGAGNKHCVSGGSPEQENEIELLKAFPAGDTVKLYVAAPPAVTVWVDEDAVKIKSCATARVTGTVWVNAAGSVPTA